ncbi:cbb3-type cytochrome c oxidase subunit I [Noviherbaspirillum galbum]|uniref:Cbb3-type cytochrome c oxidase subunit I n=1 Tax=Noviherbaspirillum galbum TaxID=2709383 RepID=A0A6B3SN26_9BURK|nr:cbb3-type cytochrome c oxidase subunit I [Noviherbaspirillum galbum]NEX62290.1 cbb3-type cytochrome c oxidase subunit I [Noviherbaspirillum galbum]
MQATQQTIPVQLTTRFSSTGAIWIKLGVLYLLVGVGLGIMMGASEDFTLRPVHAHINLLGWATMALAGLTYAVFPEAGRSKLAQIHFWLANVSLPVMAVSLALILTGTRQALPALVISEMLAALGIITFAINLFLNLGNRQA